MVKLFESQNIGQLIVPRNTSHVITVGAIVSIFFLYSNSSSFFFVVKGKPNSLNILNNFSHSTGGSRSS